MKHDPGAPRGERQWRIGWYMPYVLSTYDPNTLFAGANKLLESTDRGTTWKAISPDVSEPAGGARAPVPYGTITMIAESPLQRGLLYVGTEGGHIRKTPDGGAHWADADAGLPAHWVSSLVASKYDAGAAYAAFTDYREDDSRAYLYRTTDFGASWTSIAGNLPNESINVVREDPKNPAIPYVGTDAGVYASLDSGRTWVSLSATLPTTPVMDIVVHPRDDQIVIGTHGRGVFMLDARPIQQWNAARADGVRLFEPHPALVRIVDETEPNGTPGTATVAFALNTAGPATLTIRDKAGAIVKKITTDGSAGLNVVNWNLLVGGGPEGERPATPGDYRVTLSSSGRTATTTLRLNRFVRWDAPNAR